MNKFLELYKSNKQLTLSDKEELVNLFSDYLTFDSVFGFESLNPRNIEFILKKYGWFWVTLDSDPTIRKQPHAVILFDISINRDIESILLKYYDVFSGNVEEELFGSFIKRVTLGSFDINKSIIRLSSGPFEGKIKKVKKPKWKDVFNGYPKWFDTSSNSYHDNSAADVFTSILGSDYDSTIFDDACATRVSLGLLSGGINVRKSFLIKLGTHKGKGFIASARGLKNWLTNTVGSADIIINGPSNFVDVKSKIGTKNGIYIIIGKLGTSTGHASLWIGADQNAIGGKNYVASGGDIYFWELN